MDVEITKPASVFLSNNAIDLLIVHERKVNVVIASQKFGYGNKLLSLPK